jgi:hypothetical protein
MYKIIIVLNCSPQNLLFTYKTLGSQKKVRSIIDEALRDCVPASIDDDYGRHVDIERGVIASALYFDVGEDLEAQADEQLLKQRANAKLKNRVTNDPVMRLTGGTH